ncbi:MAG: GDSL-like Lipase/Acylhydrolase [Marmoricola sp.]|nr:GDSL-like Lipase/Acylhydrolase [Marmoricola sp.]
MLCCQSPAWAQIWLYGRCVGLIRVSRRTVACALAGAGLVLAMAAVPGSAGATPTADPLCVDAPATTAPQTNVLLLGDSITEGSPGDYTWRYFAWKHLVQGGVNVNFVGPSSGMLDIVGRYLDSHDYVCPFDEDHDAIPGGLIAYYLAPSAADPSQTRMHYDVSHYAADAVVLYAGIGDLFQNDDQLPGDDPNVPDTPQQALDHAHQAVQEAQAANPDVKIVIGTGATYPDSVFRSALQQHVRTFNQLLEDDAPTWSVAGHSQVVVAQTGKNWGGTDLTYDNQHPNVQGEVGLAAIIDESLHDVGIGPAAEPVPDLTAYLGPRQPADLLAPTTSGASVNLTWTLVPGATRSAIERREVGTSTWTTLAEPPASVADRAPTDPPACTDADGHVLGADPNVQLVAPYTCTYSDPTTVIGHSYVYRIRLAKILLFATQLTSNEITVNGLGPAPFGTALAPQVVAGVHAVTISWHPDSQATGYTVEWRPGTSGSWSSHTVAGAAASSYKITGLRTDATYQVRVTAVRAGASGPPTATLSAKVKGAVLAAPGTPVLKIAKGQRIQMTWAARAGASRYQVQIEKSGHWVVVGSPVHAAFTSGRLTKGRTYPVRVRAYDGSVAGAYSAVARIKVH